MASGGSKRLLSQLDMTPEEGNGAQVCITIPLALWYYLFILLFAYACIHNKKKNLFFFLSLPLTNSQLFFRVLCLYVCVCVVCMYLCAYPFIVLLL